MKPKFHQKRFRHSAKFGRPIAKRHFEQRKIIKLKNLFQIKVPTIEYEKSLLDQKCPPLAVKLLLN